LPSLGTKWMVSFIYEINSTHTRQKDCAYQWKQGSSAENIVWKKGSVNNQTRGEVFSPKPLTVESNHVCIIKY